jgi:hypothetical protein
MADQEDHETIIGADDGTDGAGTEEEAEVEGFGGINTTRSNIKRPGVTATPGIGGIGGVGPSEIAIKEQGVK